MKSLVFLGILALLPAAAMAQERSAGQSYDAQTNWSALKASIDALVNQNKMIAATIDSLGDKVNAIAACSAQQKLWTGGTTCVEINVSNTTTNPPMRTETATFTIPAKFGLGMTKPEYVVADDAFCKGKGYDGLQSSSHYDSPYTCYRNGGGDTGPVPTTCHSYGTSAICYRLVPVNK